MVRVLAVAVLGFGLLACGDDGGSAAAAGAPGLAGGAGQPGAGQGGSGGSLQAGAGGAAGEAGAAAGGEGGAAGGAGAKQCVDTGQRPSGRSEMMGALDTKRNRVVFFGGDDGFPKNCNSAPHPIGELWSYDVDCKSFEQLTVEGGPGGRARGMAAYDEATDRLIVFGGRFRQGSSGAYTLYNEVWALDLGAMSWEQLSASGGPSARSNPAGGIVASTRELLVFGGNKSTSGLSFSPLNDLWAFHLDTREWRQVSTTGSKPKARLFHSTAIDQQGQRLFVYGGGGASAFQGPFYGDLWSLDLATGAWSLLGDVGKGAPLGRIWSQLSFDEGSGKVVLFGGHDDGPVGNNNDTWLFEPEAKAWTMVVPPEEVKTPAAAFCQFPPDFTVPNLDAPDRRSAQLWGHDPTGRKVTVFGGKTDCGLIDDVWSLDLDALKWTRQVEAVIGESCLRRPNPEQCTGMCL